MLYRWLLFAALPLASPLLWGAAMERETVLDRYVAEVDAVYAWEERGSSKSWRHKTYFLNLVSQEWRSADEVDRTVWEHELIVTLPNMPGRSSPRNTALLLIDGGVNTSDRLTQSEDAIVLLANALRMAVAVVRQVPNQPLYFADEPEVRRTEDEILAYSMDKYLESGDESWPVHLAMTKAAVRAMDALQAYLGEERGVQIDDFVLIGASKRGWTTWLTAAVDPRVKAIMPISADLLHLREQFNHHWGAYGFYAPAVQDYVAYDLNCRVQSARGQRLLQMIDPYSYRERYTMPKLIINSVGDQFFVTDSARYYYADLPEPKVLRNTFNTDHRQGDRGQVEGVIQAAMLWVDELNQGKTTPEFTWTVEPDGAIRVDTSGGKHPDRVTLWQAHNPTARDFRLEEIGDAWVATQLSPEEDGYYYGRVERPEEGFVAYAVELRYDRSGFAGLLNLNQYYTTEVVVRPDHLPFAATACRLEQPGRLENPSSASTQSGIGLFSGWVCDAPSVEIEINRQRYLPAAHGTTRRDTEAVCGNTQSGFGLLYNFNLLGDGSHQVRALSEGRVIGSAEFAVTTLGGEYLRGLSGGYRLRDFPRPGEQVRVQWEEGLQNFAISAWGAQEQPAPTPLERGATPRGRLENPANGSYQSGISLISGWVCDAQEVQVEINGERTLALSYGTHRGDTAAVCGSINNGFGLLYNLNLLGTGEHEMRLLADGVEIDRGRFVVTTLGAEFLRGSAGYFRLPDFPEAGHSVDLRWNESRQQFLMERHDRGE